MRVAWLAVLAGCSYSAPTGSNPDNPDAAPIDTPPPITCGDLTCDGNSTCDPTGPSCSCNTGFTGDGMTCTDVDECAANNGGCAAACENTPGSFTCFVPETCSDLLPHLPADTDGEYTLFLGGDTDKPYTVYCADMATTPREFLTLTGENFAQYTAGGSSPGTSVRTTYTRVRFVVDGPAIDITDRTFATSTGMLDHANSNMQVTSMPFGTAMDCRGNHSATGVAAIDLRNTQFALVGSGSFQSGGFQPGSSLSITSNNQVAAITGGGSCGWVSPLGANFNPFNDNANGVTLSVTYR